MEPVLFREIQRFGSNMLWAFCLVLPPVALSAILVYRAATGLPEPQPSNLAIVTLLLLEGVPAFLVAARVKLITEITATEIRYGWNFPSSELNVIRVEDIEEFAIIRYRFVGYGYKRTRLYGTVYNVSGKMGLQLKTRTGERLLIGTHREEALRALRLSLFPRTGRF